MKSSYLPQSFVTQVPSVWHVALQSLGLESENALTSLQVDLDAQLRFAQEILIVTDRRLLALQRGPQGQIQHQFWELGAGLCMRHADHAGVGTLELLDDRQRLACWRFTLRHNPQALLLQDLLNLRCSGQGGSTSGPAESTHEDDMATVRTWGLFRLWRFAQPYRNQLLLGLGLTLASTAFTLVPPYMTMPLMDQVLIPFQNGQPIDPWRVALYLSGLFVAALLAWGLGWYKTYILALVSERIGADSFMFAKRQFVFLPLALVMTLSISLVSPRHVRRLALLVFCGSVVLLADLIRLLRMPLRCVRDFALYLRGQWRVMLALAVYYASALALFRHEGFDHALELVRQIFDTGGKGHSCGIYSFSDENINRLALMAPVSRIMVRQVQSRANAGNFNNGMPMTSSMGCGIWGGNITNENISLKHYMNVTWVSRPIPEDRPSEAELFGEFYNTATF